MKRIGAIYCRVSLNEQNPKHQEEFLSEYCNHKNIQVYKIYTDIIRGFRDSRPELDQMMQDMRQGHFNCIVNYKVDRFGRSTKHLLTLCEECYNKDISLIFATQDIDTRTPIGKLFFTILGSIAEFESQLISERTKLGQRNAKNIGKRGKDKKKRRTSGYHKRWEKKNKKMGV